MDRAISSIPLRSLAAYAYAGAYAPHKLFFRTLLESNRKLITKTKKTFLLTINAKIRRETFWSSGMVAVAS